MHRRPITVLAAALALLLTSAAQAQTPTPTPTVTPSPTATAGESQSSTTAGPPKNASKEVKAIYTDYGDDGKVEACDHSRDDLQKALDTITPEFDSDYPDFRVGLEAAIKVHDKNECANESTGTTATPTPAPTTSSTPAAGGVAPSTSAAPSSTPESGQLPPTDKEGRGATQPSATASPALTVAPSTPTISPSITPIPSATVAGSPTPAITRAAHGSLAFPLTLLGAALLGLLLLAGFGLASRRSPRLNHAWREAAFRTRGTWADFADWLRLGR
jgi:hypothetical protein